MKATHGLPFRHQCTLGVLPGPTVVIPCPLSHDIRAHARACVLVCSGFGCQELWSGQVGLTGTVSSTRVFTSAYVYVFHVDGDITEKHTSRHLTSQHEKTICDRTLYNSCCRHTTRKSLKTHGITKDHDITCQCVCVKKMTARKAMIIVRVDSGNAKEDTGPSMLN